MTKIHDRLLDQGLLDQIAPDNGNAISQSTFLWNGFLHEWQRHVVGAQTPHRLGGFANYLDDERHTVDNRTWLALANANFGFAPGDDGDYAFPSTVYGLVHSPDIVVARGRYTFQFSDQISGKPPEARTSLDKAVSISLNRPELDRGKRDNYAVILRGWEIAIGKPGPPSSRGSAWVYKLRLAIEDVQRQSDALQTKFRLDLRRGWTPALGGGKALEERLDFTVTVHFTVIGGNNDAFRVTPAPTATLRRNIHSGGLAVPGTLAGAPGFAHGTMAMTGFGYELIETNDHEKLGRYMTSLTFQALDKDYRPATGAMSYESVMGFRRPTPSSTAQPSTSFTRCCCNSPSGRR